MGEQMMFPNTIEEFIDEHKFIDKEKVYTNGSELIQVFRIKQWLEHHDNEIERLNNIIDELEKYLEKIIIDGGTRGSMTFWYRQIYEYLKELKEGK